MEEEHQWLCSSNRIHWHNSIRMVMIFSNARLKTISSSRPFRVEFRCDEQLHSSTFVGIVRWQSILLNDASSSITISRFSTRDERRLLFPVHLHSHGQNDTLTTFNSIEQPQFNDEDYQNRSVAIHLSFLFNRFVSLDMSAHGELPKLYCTNLPDNCKANDLQRLFSPFGHVIDCVILWDYYAFVTFQNFPEAERALLALHGYSWQDRRLIVEWSRASGRRQQQQTSPSPPTSGFGSFACKFTDGSRQLVEIRSFFSLQRICQHRRHPVLVHRR